MNGLTKEQLMKMRRHYIRRALADRAMIKGNRINGLPFSNLTAYKKENLRFAKDLKDFWPIICGVA